MEISVIKSNNKTDASFKFVKVCECFCEDQSKYELCSSFIKTFISLVMGTVAQRRLHLKNSNRCVYIDPHQQKKIKFHIFFLSCPFQLPFKRYGIFECAICGGEKYVIQLTKIFQYIAQSWDKRNQRVYQRTGKLPNFKLHLAIFVDDRWAEVVIT